VHFNSKRIHKIIITISPLTLYYHAYGPCGDPPQCNRIIIIILIVLIVDRRPTVARKI